MLNGIDVSSHQAHLPAAAGSFVIARAAYGWTADTLYRSHVAAARARGLVVGAYLFGRHGRIHDQVAALADQLAAAPADIVALDLERDGGLVAMTTAEAGDFIAAAQDALGQGVGLYHSTSGYPNVGQAWRWVADYRARYGLTGPPIPWDVWQWTSSNGTLDRDRFDGTAAELRALGAGVTAGGNQPATGGSDMRFINLSPGVVPTRLINVGKGSTWYWLDGTPAGKIPADAALPWLGKGDSETGEHVVELETALPYPADKVARPSGILVRSTNQPYDVSVPPAPGPVVDCDDVVTTELEAAAVRAAEAVKNRET
jgi:Glycosyl hydrolases family 25